MVKTYVGPVTEGVEVVIAGKTYGLLKPGESIAVPDEVAESVAWADSLWRDGPVPDKGKGSNKE